MNRNLKKWIPIIVVVAVVAIIVITNRQQKPLPGYNGAEDVFTTPAETVKTYEGTVHTDEQTGFSVFIPEDWQYVLKSGYPTYVHKPSASSIQIQVSDYDPTVNSVTAESLSEEVAASGGSFIGLDWFGNSAYVMKYMLPMGDAYTDYIEVVDYDRNHVIRVIYTFRDEYYQELSGVITYSMDSIVWDKQNPFPEGIHMIYSLFGDFEFASPNDWIEGFEDNVYFAQDPETGSSYTVTVNESTALYTDYTQLDYVNFVGNGRSNFSVSSYYADSNVIRAEGAYYSNGNRIMIRQYLLATGEYEYMVTEECPADAYTYVAQVFDDLLNCFRVFAPMRTPVNENTDAGTPTSDNFNNNLQAFDEAYKEASDNMEQSGSGELQEGSEQMLEDMYAMGYLEEMPVIDQ